MNKQVSNIRTLPQEAYDFYMFHPVRFAEDQILCLQPYQVILDEINHRLEPQTKIILDAVAKHDYVSIFSGRGCTKTTSLALLAIWWIWSRKDARVIATSPKYDTLKATLWAEIAKWLSRSNLKDEIQLTGERIYHVDPDMQSFGQMMTSKDKENISGFHATHVLWLVDEASNVARDIIDAILGGMNDPESKIVMAGNPTRASGPFFDTHNKERDLWYKIRFSSEDSERKSKIWFMRAQRHPKNSDWYRVYVDGLPPLGNPKAIISLADCHAAKDRTVEAGDYLEMGIDPAREGDDMATIAIRQGMKLLEVRAYEKTKGPELERYALSMLREYRRKTGIRTKVRIKVDDNGIGGFLGDYMALNTTDNIEMVPCLFNGAGDETYQDAASRMWGNMAEIIDTVEICDDEDLIEELSTREWAGDTGKLKVEAKSIYKKRVGKSPDKADACILCYYTGIRMVLSKPDSIGGDDAIVSDFVIDWHYANLMNPAFNGIFMIDVLHYAALVFNDDLTVRGLAAVYQQYSDKLWIYAEFYKEHPEPDVIAQMVRRETRYDVYKDDRKVKVIGNDKMFSNAVDRRPLAEVLQRSRLYVRPADRFDEYGAVALGTRMYSLGNIKIHEKLTEVRKAVGLWLVKKGKINAEENGFALALLFILSEIRRKKKIKTAPEKQRDYRPVFQSVRKEKSSNGWCTR